MPQNFWKIDVNDPSQIDKIAFKEKKIVFLLLSKKIIQKRTTMHFHLSISTAMKALYYKRQWKNTPKFL
jgi:hypothetical protein